MNQESDTEEEEAGEDAWGEVRVGSSRLGF